MYMYFVLLICLSVLMPTPDCFDYCSSMVSLQISVTNPKFYLLVKNCFILSRSFVFLYVLELACSFLQNTSWDLIGIALRLEITVWRNDILGFEILPYNKLTSQPEQFYGYWQYIQIPGPESKNLITHSNGNSWNITYSCAGSLSPVSHQATWNRPSDT